MNFDYVSDYAYIKPLYAKFEGQMERLLPSWKFNTFSFLDFSIFCFKEGLSGCIEWAYM